VSRFAYDLASFQYQKDFRTPCNKCTVLGKLTSGSSRISQTYENTASQATYGVRQRVITDERITSAAEALARATVEVEQYAYPQETGSITFWKDGIEVGKLLTIYAPTYGCDGDYRINRLAIRWRQSPTKTWYTAEFGAFRPDLAKALRQLRELSLDKPDTPVAMPSDSSVGDAKLDRTTDPIVIKATDIESITANQITGQITADQIDTVNATSISGLIQAGQIDSLTAGQITGVIVTSQLQDQILNTLKKFSTDLAPIKRVATLPGLPDADYPAGVIVLNAADDKLYKNAADSWTAVTAKDSISGLLTAGDIDSINASQIVGLITAGQIDTINADQITGQLTAGQIASVNASSITGQITSDQIDSITAGQITGLIQANQINTITFNQVTNVTINDSHIGTVHADQLIFSGQSLNIDAGINYTGSGTFTISSSGGLSITASGGLSVTGGDVTISASHKLSMNGGIIEIDQGTISGTVSFGGSISVNIAVTTAAITANTPTGTALTVNAGSAIMATGQFVGAGGVSTSGVINTTNAFQISGTAVIDSGRSGHFVDIDASGAYKMDGSEIINTSKQFVGAGVVCTTAGIGGTGFNVYQSGWYYGVTGPTSFTTADGKTVTVRGGVIVSIA